MCDFSNDVYIGGSFWIVCLLPSVALALQSTQQKRSWTMVSLSTLS